MTDDPTEHARSDDHAAEGDPSDRSRRWILQSALRATATAAAIVGGMSTRAQAVPPTACNPGCSPNPCDPQQCPPLIGCAPPGL